MGLFPKGKILKVKNSERILKKWGKNPEWILKKWWQILNGWRREGAENFDFSLSNRPRILKKW